MAGILVGMLVPAVALALFAIYFAIVFYRKHQKSNELKINLVHSNYYQDMGSDENSHLAELTPTEKSFENKVAKRDHQQEEETESESPELPTRPAPPVPAASTSATPTVTNAPLVKLDMDSDML